MTTASIRAQKRRMLSIMRLILLFLLAAFAAAPAIRGIQGAALSQPSSNELDSDEILVLTAVLEAAYTPIGRGWVLVAGRTTTYACNPPAKTGLDVDGCSGMRVSGETPDERLAAVRSVLPEISAEMGADLLKKSQVPAVLSQPLPTDVPQVVWAPGLKGDFKFSGDPAFAAYMSRVGFDRRREKALVYLGTLNWTDRGKSIGQYLLVTKQGNRWRVSGHTKVWDRSTAA